MSAKRLFIVFVQAAAATAFLFVLFRLLGWVGSPEDSVGTWGGDIAVRAVLMAASWTVIQALIDRREARALAAESLDDVAR